MRLAVRRRYTFGEYFALEEISPVRHEFVGGQTRTEAIRSKLGRVGAPQRQAPHIQEADVRGGTGDVSASLSAALARAPSPCGRSRPEEEFYYAFAVFLRDFTNTSPLEILARLGETVNAPQATSSVLDSYDAFSAILDEKSTRDELDKLKFKDAADNPTYKLTRSMGADFQSALTKIFF